MADMSRVFAVSLTGGQGAPVPIQRTDDILAAPSARRALIASGAVLLAFVLGAVLLTVSRSETGGGAEQIAAVRQLLSRGQVPTVEVTTEGLVRSQLGVLDLWRLHAGDEVPALRPLVGADVALSAAPASDGWVVRSEDQDALLDVGGTTLSALVVTEDAPSARIDLDLSLLAAHPGTQGGAAVTARPATTPLAAVESYLRSWLTSDGPGLAAVVATSTRDPLLRFPEAFGGVAGSDASFELRRSSFEVEPVAVPWERRVVLTQMEAVPLAATSAEVRVVAGCVALVTPAAAEEPPAADCLTQGAAVFGRPLPLEVIVTQTDAGWVVDHGRTEVATWATVLQQAPAAGPGLLRAHLEAWGVAPVTRAVPPIPTLESAPVAPDPNPMPPSSPQPPADTTPPAPDPVDVAPLQQRVPQVPFDAVVMDFLNGTFDATRLAEVGMVGTAADLEEFGFVAAESRAWQQGSGGTLVMVLRYSSPSAAASEFAIFHGASVAAGRPGVAAYGPGDFEGPTDQGDGVVQYRLVILSGPDHVVIETWGPAGEVIERAESLAAVWG